MSDIDIKIKLIKNNSKAFDMNDQIEIQEEADSVADAIAAVALTSVFVVACIFWISGQ